ncbi:MAG: putative bifunctional diguanylate cyclase/phosphodiesterase [Rhodothalassiaceae bacterium]
MLSANAVVPVLPQHDLQLMMLALVLAWLTGLTSTFLANHARVAPPPRRLGWTVLVGVTLGCGLWTFHNQALLALDPSLSLGFRPGLAAVALAAALATGLIGIFVRFISTRVWVGLLGSVIMAAGSLLVHFLTCKAILRTDLIVYSNQSAVAAFLASVLVLLISGRVGMRSLRRRRLIAMGLLIGSSFAVTHVVALVGATLPPEPAGAVPAGAPRSLLIAATTVGAALVLGLSLLGALVDRRLEGRALRETQRLRDLANAALEGIALVREGQIVIANGSLAALTGRTDGQLQDLSVLHLFRRDDQPTVLSALAQPDGRRREARLINAQGMEIPVEVIVRTLPGEGHAPLPVMVFRDLREKRAAEARIRHLSQHDSLTDLPNRTLFYARLHQGLERGRRNRSMLSLILVDIQRFKQVNEVKGQQVGDAMLRAVAARLMESVRANDTLARLAGDQFAILQEDVEATSQVDHLARRLLSGMQTPVMINGEETGISVAIGISVFPDDGDDESVLLAHAESALKRAKADGGSAFRFFEPDMDRELRDRQTLALQMRHAQRRGEFRMHYQPVADGSSGAIVGFEALMRWEHPDKGWVSPGLFIPVAEESGFISDLGQWALSEVCAEAASWSEALKVAVNVSPVQFRCEAFLSHLDETLKRTGLAPDRLELEVTEGALIEDVEGAVVLLNRLKQLGVCIAMDDFGTGYSSLNYLQRFPFDKLKIDRSFVLGLGEDPQSTAIVRGVIGLARGLGVTVVAEGVETEQHLAALRCEGCDLVQGYFLGRPQPIERYHAIVQAPRAAASSL